MEYFDAMVADIHGTRIKELYELRKQGRPGRSASTFPRKYRWPWKAYASDSAEAPSSPSRTRRNTFPGTSVLCPLIKSSF